MPAEKPCKARDHRRWRCHYTRDHEGDHAFTDADEMRHLREKLANWEKRKARIQRWIEQDQASSGKTLVNGDTVWRMLEGYIS